ncbi:MAG: monofunctional glycosyltransferase [Actinomycetota bacterium]|nr:monofunctional glycosyltransferase [Actinomycetota bacterium]
MTTATRARVRPAAPPPVRRSRGPRIVRRMLKAVVALTLLGLLVLGAGWVLTPSVDDAAALVSAHLAAHSAPALKGAIPVEMADALIATENSRFYSVPGVDPISVLRAPFALAFNRDQGGATLEQQLAKNLYEQGSQGLTAQAAEGVLALKLDASWSKAQILRMYLDDGYYGHGFYGLTSAAEGYFGVQPAALTWSQASLLAGLFQAPSAYDPFRHADVARARQEHVLNRLVAVGDLTRAEADRVLAEPWGLRPLT